MVELATLISLIQKLFLNYNVVSTLNYSSSFDISNFLALLLLLADVSYLTSLALPKTMLYKQCYMVFFYDFVLNLQVKE